MLNKRFCKKVYSFIILFLFLGAAVFAEEETWTIAAQKFTYGRGQKHDSVTEATGEMFTSRILENLSDSLIRTIHEDEEIERLRYKSKIERSKLFLELSNEVQKRDALILENYTKRELQTKLEEKNKNIEEVREKIKKNLADLEAAEKKIEAKRNGETSENKSFNMEQLIGVVKNAFNNESSDVTLEKVVLYKNDISALFTPSEDAQKGGVKSLDFQKEINSAKIDGLLCGNIISYGNFLSLTVDLYAFPGGNKLGSVTEIGGLEDADFIASSIARQLVPLISNSLPVTLYFDIEPEEISGKTSLYIDEQFFSVIPDHLVTNSGTHRIEFQSNGYKSLTTSYYFYGNKSYHVTVQMEESDYVEINVNLAQPMTGDLFAKGIFQNHIETFEDEKGKTVSSTSTIKVNGDSILGQFVDVDGHGAFFYIDSISLAKGNKFVLDPKTFDRSDYIDKRRKIMYGAYSGLVVSLIPSLWVSTGRWTSISNDLSLDSTAANVISKAAMAVPIAFGAFFVYEFVRYLMAADSVLPSIPKVTNDFDFYVPPVIVPEADNAESEEITNTTESNSSVEDIVVLDDNSSETENEINKTQDKIEN